MQTTTTQALGRRLLAAKPDAPDFRDFIYDPALIALRPSMPVPPGLRIRDQGRSPACTGFGLAAVIDLLRRRDGDRDSDVRETAVSARMLYEMALRHDEWAGEADSGSSCRGAIKGWYNMGVCREALYPSTTSHRGSWSVEAAKDARKCTVGAYYRLGSRISDYHAAINEVGAILCSARLHEGWKKPDPQTGHMKLYRNSLGGHAFAIVGYDNEGFWIQNSWGENWGNGGTALWTYPDWQLNVLDAWVFQVALPTPQIWHLPARTRARSGWAANPARTEIAGHFVHIDDGRFRDTGRYWSNLDDVRLTARHLANSDKYDHLLLYAHGGLNSPGDSARRIAAMKETFKANRIYPYHLMYDTGLLEELKDVIVGRRKQADDRAGGLADWLDRLIEKLTRTPGRALWREMKAGAELPFKDGQAGTQTLQALVDAFEASGKPKAIHLAGHSTGMILLAHLLRRWSVIAPGHIIRTVSLMAPAGGIDLFTEAMQPFLKAPYPGFRIAEMTIYNLTDELEQDDQVSLAYNKSLLYLVSNAFEEQTPMPILGMEKYSETVSRRKLPRLTVRYSRGAVPSARVTASESHGGFDNDPLTMNHLVRRVLRSAGQKPVREFTAASLEY